MLENYASLFSALGLGYLAVAAWPLARTDIRHRRLPNRLVLPAFPITLLGQLGATFFGESWLRLGLALLSSLIVFLAALGINHFGYLGMGDVKLMSVMVLALAWYSPLFGILALLLTFLVAGLSALGLLLTKRITLRASLPLGPYLLVGFIASATWAVWS